MKSKFNIIDLIVIIVLVLAIAVGGFVGYKYFFGDNGSASANVVKLNFVIEISSVSEDIAKAYKVGDKVNFGSQGSGNGVITNVEVVPYRVWNKNTEIGEIVISEVPDKYTAKITIESDVVKTDKFYMCNDESIVIGKMMPFAVKGASADCYVVDLYE